MNLLSIVGARPQFVKLAPFSRAVRGRGWNETIVHTGQHYNPNMSELFFDELGIPAPDFNLGVGSGEPGAQTAAMLEGIEELLLERRPDAVVVFGDTNSTLAGALAGRKLGIPVVHVEAGLRSFNRSMPEETNRIVADHLADILFAPTCKAVAHLDREGLSSRVFHTGDITVDAILENRKRAECNSTVLTDLELESGQFSLLTLHRPYTVDDPQTLNSLLNQLKELDGTILFPVHPRTRKTLETVRISVGDGGSITGNLRVIEPLGYLDFLKLMIHSKRILTDSGGIQKEAYLLRKPCVTLRPETEWVETVESGWNVLLPVESDDLADRIRGFQPSGEQPPIFGRNVSRQMMDAIEAGISPLGLKRDNELLAAER